jgi:hypothetical protein
LVAAESPLIGAELTLPPPPSSPVTPGAAPVSFVVTPVDVPDALEPPESPHATNASAREARTCKDESRE